MRLIVRKEAEADIVEGFNWYEQRRQGLGKAFLAELSVGFEAVLRHASRFPKVHHHIRRASLRRFPYGVFFVMHAETISVLAVMHNARNPRRWISRN